MRLKTLADVFECAIAGTNEPKHLNTLLKTRTLLKARDEIIALANQCEDGLDTDVSIVSWYAFSCLMNVATYNNFGPICKLHSMNNRALKRGYRDAVRSNICEEFTDAQIDGVADFLSDLWHDNEASGAHLADGTFAPSDNCITDDFKGRINELGDIINKLYHHRGLSPDDIVAIEMFIH